MTDENPKYKDRLFAFIFGSDENREWTLSLYNALNHSDYKDPGEIEITTIDGVVYIGRYNDVSFIIAGDMNIYEQQSTFNPNMPVRMLQYAGHLYGKYIKQHNCHQFGSKQLELPVPRLIVFYNGMSSKTDECILKLSSSFKLKSSSEPDIEVRVRMLNINYGHNKNLLDACNALGAYSWLVEEVRLHEKEIGRMRAIDRAINTMPDDFVIKRFLVLNRTEVRGMLFDDMTLEEVRALDRRDTREEEQERILNNLLAYGINPQDAKRLVEDAGNVI